MLMLSPFSLTTKLMAIVAAIGAGYALLIVLFLFTLNNIKLSQDILFDQDLPRIRDNAKLGRELVHIVSDTNHVITAFYKKDDLLRRQSGIISTKTSSLISGSSDVRLKEILQQFAEEVDLVFKQCREINELHADIESMTGEFRAYAGSMGQFIDSQMVKRSLGGEKLDDLQMLREMIPGILATVVDIDNIFNALGIEYFKASTIEADHPIFNLADDLWWRTHHIGDTEPSVRDTTRQFMGKIEDYTQTILVFNVNARGLNQRLIEMNARMDDLLNYLEESDLLLNKEGVEMKREVTDAFLFYRNFMLAFSIALVLFVIFLAVHFVMSNIKKPMALINDGIESISQGDLNTTINLNRNDEWATIESALNRMVSELKSLYDRIERSRDSLEKDVKERTRDLEITNEDLELAKEASEAANQAKSMFLSNMSHELRTPLSAILGFSQMMGRDLTIGEDQRENISIINRSGKHLLNLINDILDIAKIEAGRETLDTRTIDLSAFLSEISELFYSRITDKGLFFTVDKSDDLPRYIKSDEGKLRQVLINLLGNALKFTETGGVTLRVQSGALAENVQTLHIEVEDTGIGIDSDQLENIFDPFIQAGHSQTGTKGTGLGLAICKSFVELLGGEISVESKPGEGSLFRVGLAVTLAECAEVSGIEVIGPAVIGLEPGQSAWRILVVEDDAENRLLLNSLLLQVGFDTRQAENGEEAVVLFKQWQPHFIWMDMRMPVMDGYAATKKIREIPGGKEVKIVAVTAHAFTEHDEEILAAGCDGLVRKPYLVHEIFDTIAQHLGVEYLLGETAEAPAPEETTPITAEMLSELPAEIIEELREAALALNREAISATLERIEPQSPNIASGLRSLLGGIQIGRIRDLLDAVQ